MVRTRIAPSPTGEDLHIGNLYTALLNWTWARKNNGAFIIRIEDTDRTRLVPGSEEQILKTLAAFGLSPDEPFCRQSERLSIYHEYVEQLVDKGHAYYCFCTPERLDTVRKEQIAQKKQPKYDRHCLSLSPNEVNEKIERGEPHVIRMKIPEGKTTFHDVIHGDITIDNATIDDTILLKSDQFPTYHLAVVIDDHLMNITHVIRAEEWIPSTPKHVLLYHMFGWQLPVFVHTPILRNPDKSKLSKRKNPVWSSWYLAQGYLPDAILNYFGLMGWSHPEGKEIFNRDEFIRLFDIKDIQSVGPVFDIAKLTWMNGEYIRMMDLSQLTKKIHNFFGDRYSIELTKQIVPLVQERIKTLQEFDTYSSFFLAAPAAYEQDLSAQRDLLISIAGRLDSLTDWTAQNIGYVLEELAREKSVSNSKLFMALRIAITGKKITPPINESMVTLGKTESIARIKKAAE